MMYAVILTWKRPNIGNGLNPKRFLSKEGSGGLDYGKRNILGGAS